MSMSANLRLKPLIAVASAAALASAVLVDLSTDHRAGAAPSAGAIQHVVVIYQENHSFDETLGQLCQTRTTPCNGFTGTVALKGGTRVAMRQSPDCLLYTSDAADEEDSV